MCENNKDIIIKINIRTAVVLLFVGLGIMACNHDALTSRLSDIESSLSDIGLDISDLKAKLSKVENDVDYIESDVSSMESDIDDIEINTSKLRYL